MTRVATTIIGWEGEGTVGLVCDGQQVVHGYQRSLSMTCSNTDSHEGFARARS